MRDSQQIRKAPQLSVSGTPLAAHNSDTVTSPSPVSSLNSGPHRFRRAGWLWGLERDRQTGTRVQRYGVDWTCVGRAACCATLSARGACVPLMKGGTSRRAGAARWCAWWGRIRRRNARRIPGSCTRQARGRRLVLGREGVWLVGW